MNPDLEQLEKIKNATKATPEFSLDGMTSLCKVVDVYDGDSIKVVFFVNNIYIFRCQFLFKVLSLLYYKWVNIYLQL